MGPNGVFDAERLATGGAAGQVLAWTGTGSEWTNSPDQSRWVIEDANVGGTNDALTLTTGDSLTGDSRRRGFRLQVTYFSQHRAGYGRYRRDWPCRDKVWRRRSAPGSHRPIRAGEIAARQDYIINFDGFTMESAPVFGIAGNYEQWEASAITEGVLDAERLASGGTDGQVLTRTATGQGWENSAGGAGDTNYYPIPDADVGGTADAITLTSGQSLSAYVNGMMFFFASNFANTGAVTVDVDGIGTMEIGKCYAAKVPGSPLEAKRHERRQRLPPTILITLVYGTDVQHVLLCSRYTDRHGSCEAERRRLRARRCRPATGQLVHRLTFGAWRNRRPGNSRARRPGRDGPSLRFYPTEHPCLATAQAIPCKSPWAGSALTSC